MPPAPLLPLMSHNIFNNLGYIEDSSVGWGEMVSIG
jgi:hypothetical protein